MLEQSGEVIKNIGHYILDRTIGQGTFGKVRLGQHLMTKEKVAIKILQKDKIRENSDLERVSREINILKSMRHPNIIHLYEIVETPSCLYLIMEYMVGGELFDYIIKNTRIQEREAAQFLLQLISGVQYTNSLGIVHRDLKPENLLLDRQQNIKIIDFGLSNLYSKGQQLKTACGSPCYAAPEMIAGKCYDGLRVDVWSCGVILYAMLCGHLPFEDPVIGNLYRKIISGDYLIPQYLSSHARDLLAKFLVIDPSKRITIDEVIKHPWMQYNLNSNNVQLIPGQIIGQDVFDFDENILEQLFQFNINIDYAKQLLEDNHHNHITTSYFLLKKKDLDSPKQKQINKPTQNIFSNINQNYEYITRNPVDSQKKNNIHIEIPEILSISPIRTDSILSKNSNNGYSRKRTLSALQEKSEKSISIEPKKSQHFIKKDTSNLEDSINVLKNFQKADHWKQTNHKSNNYVENSGVKLNLPQNTQKSLSPKIMDKFRQHSQSPGFKKFVTQIPEKPLISARARRLNSPRPESINQIRFIRIHKGPYHLNQITTIPALQLVKNLKKLFIQNQLTILEDKCPDYRLSNKSVIFDINVSRLFEAESILFVRCVLIQGNDTEFSVIESCVYNSFE